MPAEPRPVRVVRVAAFAKINLTLRVLGRRPDGDHEVRTIYQALALHDTLAFERASGPLRIVCDEGACPSDRRNLVWGAAERVWAAAGRRGAPADLLVRLGKRIPQQAGLGGGSSDAAAALRALPAFWGVRLALGAARSIAAALGADVPFFLDGGTALGVGRGERLFPLPDLPATWVALIVPSFGVSTADAYAWWDRRGSGGPRRRRGRSPAAFGLDVPEGELVNDLEGPVAARHPAIRRMVAALWQQGASYAGMSGSGSAVFGLFGRRRDAERAVAAVPPAGRRTLVTRTLGREAYARLARPAALTRAR